MVLQLPLILLRSQSTMSVRFRCSTMTSHLILGLILCGWSVSTRAFLLPSSPRHAHHATALGDDFLKGLQDRINQVSDQDTKLPILVIDTMLPRQHLKLEAEDELLRKLVLHVTQQESPVFGMIGVATLSTGQTMPLQNGVEVEVIGQPSIEGSVIRLELKAGRRMRLTGETEQTPEGWGRARVVFLDSAQEEAAEEAGDDPLALARAMALARQFTTPNASMPGGKDLVSRWIELAREREQITGQIDQLLEDLGDMPSDIEPSELAFWVGALINPLPGMGVAMEIRPQLLMARTAEERVGVALQGLVDSIGHMDGSRPLF